MDLLQILVVEDHAALRSALRELLIARYPECVVHLAASAEEGLACAAAHPLRLVLMDMELPDASGIEATAQLKARLPQVPVVVFSQHNAADYVERARAAGAADYVVKDRLARELLPAVARALGGKVADGA